MKRISQLSLFLLSASAGFGQTVLATVTGTITDQTGAAVANAPVSLKNVETGEVRNGTIDDYPGDASVIYVEALETENGQISSIDEVEEEFDDRPIVVGWHITDCDSQTWEIVDIQESTEGKGLYYDQQ